MGGVARRTREAVALCEAAGFDVILIETVGVGQSETMVAGLCDLFILLMAPAGGDELQGVKRGIMEMADLILVNKADGDLLPAATRTEADYAGALRLLRRRPQDPDGYPRARRVSAATGLGLAQAWDEMQALAAWRKAQGHWAATRAAQDSAWFVEEVRRGLLAVLEAEPARGLMQRMGQAVATGAVTPEAAAAEVLAHLRRG
jgi:LAO/AO transport system kinase